jgi:hypothetical protein
VEDPYCIPITEIFILHFLRCLIQPYRNLLLLFLRGGPGIKDRFLLEVQIVVLDLQALIDFDIEKGCRIERDVDIDILLIVEAGL